MKKIFLFAVASLAIIARGQVITVVDQTSLQPIQGVNIHPKTATKGISTNQKGEADLSWLNNQDSLYFSHVGYATSILTKTQIESASHRVMLQEKAFDLQELVVSASRFEEKREDVAQPIQVLKAKDLAFMNQQTSAEVMQNTGNVLVQKSQLGGGSPIIRGFETNKVLMVVDGVRMNNAIYRGGHLQNIITLDNNIMEKIEVTFGPGSVVYGSDALGGVMHFYTKNPTLSENDEMLVKAGAFVRHATAYNESTGHFDFNLGGKKLASFTSITYSDFGDLRQGNLRSPYNQNFGKCDFYVKRTRDKDSAFVNSDKNLQVGSAYSQIDIMQKFTYKQSESVSHLLNLQYSTSSDVPRYDRLTQTQGGNPKYAEWYYGPQKRLFASYTLNLSKATFAYDHARIILGHQQVEESRNDRRFGRDILNHRIEKLMIYTLNADFDKQIGKQEMRFGLEGTYNGVNSEAYLEDIVADTTAKLDTRYPDGGSSMQSLAAYATHTWELTPWLVLNDGIRVSNVDLKSKFIDQTFFPFPFSSVHQNNTALNGNLGFIVKPKGGWRITLLGSTGFRAPNVDDLSKVFESVPGIVIVPNPNLKPEYTYNVDLGLSKSFKDKAQVGGTVFYTLLQNAITAAPGTFNGGDSVLYDGQMSGVITTVNAAEAYIYGLNAFLNADVTRNFSITSTLNYTYGRINTDTVDYPLDHIPPVFGKTSFNLRLNKFRGEFFVMYNGWKRVKDYNMIGEDNYSYATPQGMPSWYTLNMRAAYQINQYLQVQAALENILDMNYRVYASNISAPGRNFVLTVRGLF